MTARKVSESEITMTELVLPNHTNQLGTLFGGNDGGDGGAPENQPLAARVARLELHVLGRRIRNFQRIAPGGARLCALLFWCHSDF